jgi:primosomal protein DnaI
LGKLIRQRFPEQAGFIERKSQEIKRHPDIAQLIERHCIDDKTLKQSLTRLYQYVTEIEHCRRCPGLSRCPNDMKGYTPHIDYNGVYFDFHYMPCNKKIADDNRRELEKRISSHYIPGEILNATFHEIDRDERRMDALNAVMAFCLRYREGEPRKGLYLYGPLGVGKSYMLGAACRELAKRGIPSLMVYLPDFLREIKTAIQDNSIDEKVSALQEVPVLVLDDIGAETVSAWVRDEILGAVLQYRVAANLPTLYTSNYSYDELENHLSYSYKGGLEEMKAKRIMERIRYYTDAYYVGGPNRRKTFSG